MYRLNAFLFAALAALILSTACSPALNWRDVRPGGTRLALLLPCKPDKAEKTVPLGGKPTRLMMVGCNAGGATFAVASADMGEAAMAASVLAQWQALTLENMRAQTAQATALKLPGAAVQPPAVLVKAMGRRLDGTAVSGHAAYFAQGSQVFQVVLYADQIPPGLSETFFSGIKFE